MGEGRERVIRVLSWKSSPDLAAKTELISRFKPDPIFHLALLNMTVATPKRP
jgi:hypothetical protein